jgi:uncharacterized membrane protein HdeD (DUF308 family)
MDQTYVSAHKWKATMDRNVGPEDRVVRIVVGIALAVLAYLQVLPGIATIIMAVVGAYLIISGLLSRCLFYRIADLDTSVQEQPYSNTDDRSGL